MDGRRALVRGEARRHATGIAADLLRAEERYRDLFDLNVGQASVGNGGPVLKRPDLIWPGLRLQLSRDPQGEDAELTFAAEAAGPGHSGTERASSLAHAHRGNTERARSIDGVARNPDADCARSNVGCCTGISTSTFLADAPA